MRANILVVVFVWLLASAVAVFAANCLDEGRRLEKGEDFNGAVTVYLKGIADQPSAELYLAAGRLLGKLKQYERGNALIKEALHKFPENEALQKLGTLFRSRTGAEHEVLAATGPSPVGSSDAFEPLPAAQQASAAVEIIMGLQKVDPKETKTYEDALKKLVFTCPASEYAPEGCWKLANLYLYSENQPDYEKALPLLEKIVADYPGSTVAGSSFTRLRSIAESTGNHALLLKTARQAQTLKIWNSEEANFWVCHEAAAMIGTGDRAGGLEKLRQISATADTTPRAAEYAGFLIGNL